MFIEPQINEEELNVQLELSSDWKKVMRILYSNNLIIDDAVIEGAQRNIKRPKLKTHIISKTVKNLCINGGRGVFGFRSKEARCLVGLEYAKLCELKPILIVTSFNQIKHWVTKVNEVFDHSRSINIFLGINPRIKEANVAHSRQIREGFGVYLTDVNGLKRAYGKDFFEGKLTGDKVEFAIVDNFLNNVKKVEPLCRELHSVLFVGETAFSKHQIYGSKGSYEAICWTDEQIRAIKEIEKHFDNLSDTPNERIKSIRYILRKVRLTV